MLKPIGSGALPVETLPSAGIVIRPIEKKGAGGLLEAASRAFRSLPVPLFGRIKNGEFILICAASTMRPPSSSSSVSSAFPGRRRHAPAEAAP